MKNKGFTLTELLVALAIFALVITIAIPSIISAVNRNRERQYELFTSDLITAAEEYVSENRNQFTSRICNPKCVINIDDLVKNDLLDGDIINPMSQEKLEGTSGVIIVTFVDGKINYEFQENYDEQ